MQCFVPDYLTILHGTQYLLFIFVSKSGSFPLDAIPGREKPILPQKYKNKSEPKALATVMAGWVQGQRRWMMQASPAREPIQAMKKMQKWGPSKYLGQPFSSRERGMVFPQCLFRLAQLSDMGRNYSFSSLNILQFKICKVNISESKIIQSPQIIINHQQMLSRICTRILPSFSKLKIISDYDITNMAGLTSAPDQSLMTLSQKLSMITPGNLYHSLDEFSRQALFSLANDYQAGLPLSIIVISIFLKGLYFYPNMMGQIMAIKMKDMKPQMDKFQQKMKTAQMSKNMALMKQTKHQFKEMRRKHGVDNFYALVNLTQIPLILTWFLSLRYVTAMPELFPQMNTASFLWIEDLSVYDPYFVLPVIAACTTSLSIAISPTLKHSNATMPIMMPILKYMRFVPFVSLPFTGLFPAAINLYWVTFSVMQVGLMASINTNFIQRRFGLIKEAAVSQISRAVFIDEKGENGKVQGGKVQGSRVEEVKVVFQKPKKKKKE